MPHELQAFREVLNLHARQRAALVALQGAVGRYDYGQLLSEVQQREAWLRTQPPGTFALALDNGPEAVFWDLAALLAERPCVIVPPFTPAQVRHSLDDSGVTLMLAEPDLAPTLQAAGFNEREGVWSRQVQVANALPAGTLKITYTSGSTGAPKGVCLGADAMLRVARELEAASRPSAPSTYLAVLPLGVLLENLGLYAALLAGARVMVYPQAHLGMRGAGQIDWKRLLGSIALSGAESLILVPQLLLGLVSAIEHGWTQVGPLRFVAVGGARVAQSLLARAEAVGLPVFEGYGLSECASVVCLNRPGHSDLAVSGAPAPCAGAYRRGRRSAGGRLDPAGLPGPPFTGQWWPTGDIGHFDGDGYLYLAGRKKNQFITSFGRNVNPEWVEAELTQGGVILQAFVHGEGLPLQRGAALATGPEHRGPADRAGRGPVQCRPAGLRPCTHLATPARTLQRRQCHPDRQWPSAPGPDPAALPRLVIRDC